MAKARRGPEIVGIFAEQCRLEPFDFQILPAFYPIMGILPTYFLPKNRVLTFIDSMAS